MRLRASGGSQDDGGGEQRGGFAPLDDAACLHHGDRVAKPRDGGDVVRDEKQAQAEALPERGEEIEDLELERGIERRDCLIEDQERGFQREGAGDRHPLALPAGELVRIAAEEALIQAHRGERFSRELPSRLLARGLALESQTLGDDLGDGHPRIEAGAWVLKDDLQVPPQWPPGRGGQPRELSTLEADAAGPDRHQPENGASQRRFAAA